MVALSLAGAVVAPGAAADEAPMCQYAGTTGTLAGNRALANPCVAYSGNQSCRRDAAGSASVTVVVVICLPAV